MATHASSLQKSDFADEIARQRNARGSRLMLDTVSQLVLNGIGGVALPYLVGRVITGVFFVFSGYHKLTNAERRAALVATLQACQWFVPGVEFVGGLGVAFGFLTPLAALGLAVICLIAACTDGMRRVRASAAIDKADKIDDALYLPEIPYVVLLALFVANGAGPFSLDAMLNHFL
jgi:putative oxidoreductase